MTGRAAQRSDPVSQETAARPRSFAALLALVLCATLAFAGFMALGTWQLYRLQWKHALIARVEQRVHAAPVAAPGPDCWPQVSIEADEYRHVLVTGTFLYDLTTKVQALTELGSGYWLLTPLHTTDGYVVLVNRGFVPVNTDRSRIDRRGKSDALGTARKSVVTGLLRISEPGGAFLRHNDPANNRWYSRDVQGIAAARGLSRVAPYFVDADAANAPADKKPKNGSPDHPIGGLTVVAFPDNHLIYALTWYALALMVAGACLWAVREKSRLRRSGDACTDCVDGKTEDGGKN